MTGKTQMMAVGALGHARDLPRAGTIRQAVPGLLSPARGRGHANRRQALAQNRSDGGMAGLREAALDVLPVHDAAHRLAAESLAQSIEFRDQGGEHIVGMQQVDCDEVLGDQDFAKRGIGIDAVAEQAAGEIMALAAAPR